MKSKVGIITLIIILILLVVSLTTFLYIYLTDQFGFTSIIGSFGKGSHSQDIVFDKIYEEDIKKINIISVAGDIDFKESTDENIRVIVYGEDNENLEVEVKNENELIIDYSKEKRHYLGKIYIKDIIIYIPKKYSNQIDIEAKFGDINIIDLENATISINEDCGDVSLGKVKNIKINNSYGDIKVDTILNKVEMENSCGNIKIVEVQIKENSNIESSLGDIKIENTNDIYIDAKTDLGDLDINENNRHSDIILKIKNSCGDIKINH